MPSPHTWHLGHVGLLGLICFLALLGWTISAGFVNKNCEPPDPCTRQLL